MMPSGCVIGLKLKKSSYHRFYVQPCLLKLNSQVFGALLLHQTGRKIYGDDDSSYISTVHDRQHIF